jgi:glucose/arabinose dehydrogenase
VAKGLVRVIDHGELQPEPVVDVGEPVRKEAGLLGLALDPDYQHNHRFYVYYSQNSEREIKPWRNRLVRFVESGGRGTNMQVLLDDLPIGDKNNDGGHNGGRLAFGADGKLYVSIGDAGRDLQVQDTRSAVGKVFRLNPDGSVPSNNPLLSSPVYAYGLRNIWSMALNPQNGVIYVTDNGGTAHDEVNRLQAGGNYGWPKVQGIRGDPRFLDPIWESRTERGGITGMTFYNDQLFPDYRGDLLFCTFTTARLIRLKLGGPALDEVKEEEQISDQCSLDVAVGPDGAIYVANVSSVRRLLPS